MVVRKDSERFIEDDIVISGVSGRFPEAKNVSEFLEKLLKGENFVKEDDSRWPNGYLGTYAAMGLLKDLQKFDASFFGVPPKLAERTDPTVRILLETSFEAIVDAGINPAELRGTETGVIVAVSANEAADWWSLDPDIVNGYEFLGCTRTMYSNRISFVFDLRGPSYTLDCESSSGLVGVQQGYYMLKNGMVDAVLVTGVNIAVNPHSSIVFQKLNMLAPDGKTKVFDAAADGHGRSEAGVAVLMQRKRDARRIYGTIVGTGTSCDGYKINGCQSHCRQLQVQLYKDIYRTFNIDPLQVTYVEAHGYGTKDGDATEVNGIADFFCPERSDPLLVGCVKSNLGHTEAVAGLAAFVKVLSALEDNMIAPNLHYNRPNADVAALKDGRISVCDKPVVCKDGLIAINSFGIGGSNCHLILKSNSRQKSFDQVVRTPRLICVSGRTEQTALSLLDKVKKHQNDNEFCGLISKIFSLNIPYYDYRAFYVSDPYNNDDAVEEVTPYSGVKPFVCFVFAGMGSQWQGMGKDLLQLESFKRTIDKCAETLRRENFDLYDILLSDVKSAVFENVLNSFVGITSIQVALVDVLRELFITPDFIIGHSIGELACAYADDTLSLEQTILVAYWRGKCLLTSNIPPGSMAAVGLSVDETLKRLPDDVYVACHNSADSVTISGPPASIGKVTKQLQADGIFAKEVNSSGVAFHSPYVAAAGPQFKKTLEKIIKQSKLRSRKWISTSFPEDKWNSPFASSSSVEYHLNNLLSPVLFQEALRHVPENSVVIEIAPHALLQPILKSSLPKCAHVGLLRRKQATVANFLTSIGRLYNAGLHPKVENFYPPVKYPVARKTPMISSLVEWDHSKDWFLVSFLSKRAGIQGELEKEINVTLPHYKYLLDSIVDDVPVMPISAYLVFIWEAVARFQYKRMDEVSLVIENFQIIRKCLLKPEEPLKFEVNILEDGKECEIRENGGLIARAIIRMPSDDVEDEWIPASVYNSSSVSTSAGGGDSLALKQTDVYEDLYNKGYNYKEHFKGITFVDNKGETARLRWRNNWITFIDSMLQLHIAAIDKQRFYAINHVQKIVIDPKCHYDSLNKVGNDDIGLPAVANHRFGAIRSGGVEVRGVQSTLVSLRTKQTPVKLHRWTFVPHISTKPVKRQYATNIAIYIMCENTNAHPMTLEIAEFIKLPETESVITSISGIIDDISYVDANYTVYDSSNSSTSYPVDSIRYVQTEEIPFAELNESFDLIVTENIFDNENKSYLENVKNSLKIGGFVLTREKTVISNGDDGDISEDAGLKLVTKYVTDDGKIQLLLRKPSIWRTPMVVTVRNDSFDWIESVKMAIDKHRIDNRETILIFHGQDPIGIIGMLNCIRRELPKNGLRCVFTDNSIEPYKIVNLKYIDYFRKGLVFNVHRNNEWGSYVHLPVDDSERTVETEHAFIGVTEVGNFSSLRYMEGRIPFINLADYPGHELCYVYYSSIYAHDIRCVAGNLPYDDYTNISKQGSVLGHEYAGRDSQGHRVFGMVGGGALATSVVADKDVMWNVPDNWTLEEASTVPRVYSVAYYALQIRGKVRGGETVYINAGVSGLCVACVTVARSFKAEVYIGYNGQAEISYLKKIFPEMTNEYFVDLENCNFVSHLLERTDGHGVNVIFDTLNSHKRNSFISALTVNGRLLEFEKSTVFNESLGSGATEKNITFHKISHHTLWVSESGRKHRGLIRELVQNGIQRGVIRPISPTHVFTDQQVEQAFEALRSGKYFGKILIKFREEEDRQKRVIPATKVVQALPNSFMDPEKSYIVTGGLTSFGIQIINWLISKGANKFVISSAYKPVSGYQCLMLRRWKDQHVTIVLADNVTGLSDAENLIEQAQQLASLYGIFHAAYVDCPTPFMTSTVNHFQLPWAAKLEAARYLDVASRNLCPSLRYFVAFSNVGCLYGTENFANIGYACSAMALLFEERRQEGYPATVVQFGPIKTQNVNSPGNGFVPRNISVYLDVLPEMLNTSSAVISVAVTGNKQKTSSATRADLIIAEIADILEIRKPAADVSFCTLQELGLEPVSLNEVVEIFSKYEINVKPADIPLITLDSIVSLCKDE